MQLRSLYLKNFRIYDEAHFEFGPRINVIWGANAIGKTTILEAIHFLMTGRSFRTTQTSDLISTGESCFYIEAAFIKHGIEQRLKFSYDGKERKIVYNSTQLQSATNLLGLLQGVLHAPDDVALVKGAPLQRRHFLDLQIAQVDPLYIHHLTRYNRAMRQRNSLLRSKNLTTIESWEQEMASGSAYVTLQRKSAVSDLADSAKALHTLLVGDQEAFSLNYKTGAPIDLETEALKQYHIDLFKKHRRREMDLGVTLYGPHKDDLVIGLNNSDTRHFASEGQQRSCVSTLRLAEWMRLKAVAEESPLMLIDDLGISLDSSRRRRLLSHLTELDQVFLTFTQPTDIGCSAELVNLIEVRGF